MTPAIFTGLFIPSLVPKNFTQKEQNGCQNPTTTLICLFSETTSHPYSRDANGSEGCLQFPALAFEGDLRLLIFHLQLIETTSPTGTPGSGDCRSFTRIGHVTLNDKALQQPSGMWQTGIRLQRPRL